MEEDCRSSGNFKIINEAGLFKLLVLELRLGIRFIRDLLEEATSQWKEHRTTRKF